MAPKKTTKRKTVAKKTAPAVTSAAPVMQVCPYPCSIMKRLIILVLVFAAGFATCHFTCGMHRFNKFNGGERMMPRDMFVDGCLDTSKMGNPAMAEKIATADKDNDGCITMEEMQAHRMEMRGNPDMPGKPMMRKGKK